MAEWTYNGDVREVDMACRSAAVAATGQSKSQTIALGSTHMAAYPVRHELNIGVVERLIGSM